MLDLLLVYFFCLFYWFLLQKCLSCICYSLHLGRNADTATNFDIAGVVAVSTRVLAQVICQIRTYGAGKALWPCCKLADLLVFKIPEFFEEGVLE